MADAGRLRADAPASGGAYDAAALASAMAEEKESSDVVVTGSRMDRSKSSARGDWNVCTVDDPGRNLRACRRQVDAAASGRAAAHVADGLTNAWKGDLDDAITDFDRAVAAAPRSSQAYLNRGLARKRAGNLNGALADLDQAVRYGPSARTYYQRSLILRQRGDRKRAGADERRAVDLDPRYADLIK